MFQKKIQTLKFANPITQIPSFCCAYDGTYVLQGWFHDQQFEDNKLIHIGADGYSIKYQLQLKRQVTMKMMNPYEVVLFDQKINELQIIDLKTQQSTIVSLPSTYTRPGFQWYQMELKVTDFYLFPKTQLIAFVRQGNEKGGVFYYEYEKVKNKILKCVGQHYYNGEQINFGQVDDHSKIVCWHGSFKDDKFVRNISVLDDKQKIHTLNDLDSKEKQNGVLPQSKFVYMQMLLHIDQDFDDDLLLDALRVLEADLQ